MDFEGDMDPESAAQFAQGTGEEPTGPEMGQMGGESSVLDRLFDGNAQGPPVAQLRDEYQLDQWMALVTRGVLRAAPGDGMPPIGDIGLGGMLGFRKFQVAQSSDGGDGSDGEAPGPEEFEIEEI